MQKSNVKLMVANSLEEDLGDNEDLKDKELVQL